MSKPKQIVYGILEEDGTVNMMTLRGTPQATRWACDFGDVVEVQITVKPISDAMQRHLRTTI